MNKADFESFVKMHLKSAHDFSSQDLLKLSELGIMITSVITGEELYNAFYNDGNIDLSPTSKSIQVLAKISTVLESLSKASSTQLGNVFVAFSKSAYDGVQECLRILDADDNLVMEHLASWVNRSQELENLFPSISRLDENDYNRFLMAIEVKHFTAVNASSFVRQAEKRGRGRPRKDVYARESQDIVPNIKRSVGRPRKKSPQEVVLDFRVALQKDFPKDALLNKSDGELLNILQAQADRYSCSMSDYVSYWLDKKLEDSKQNRYSCNVRFIINKQDLIEKVREQNYDAGKANGFLDMIRRTKGVEKEMISAYYLLQKHTGELVKPT